MWSETLLKDEKPFGIEGAVSHACEILDVDRSTPYRWITYVSESDRKAIIGAARKLRAGEDPGVDLPWVALLAVVFSKDELFEGLRTYLSDPTPMT